jgi:ankyrin repeat and BTB/POZ domain-containing protein 1
VVKLAAAMEPAAFNFVIRYIYMYDQPLPKQPQLLQSIIKTARKLDLVDLVREIEEQCNDMDNGNISNKEMTARARKRRGQRENDMWKARLQFEVFAEKNVIGRKVVLKEDDADLTQEQFDYLSSLQTSPDILLEVSLSTGATVYYPSHKSMLIRSEYYLTMFTSSFAEANEQEALSILELPVTSIEVAELVLTFLYTDRVDVPIACAMEVLYAADLLLIDRLKSLASITITNCTVDQLPSNMTIFDILRASWTLRNDRLERYVAKIIADNFDIYISQPEFRKIVMESANRIEARQETDTIELIDDIRFFLARKYGIIFEDERSIIVKNGNSKQAQQNDNDKGIVKVGKVEEHRWNSQYELEYNSQLDRIEDLLAQLGLDA